MLELEDAVGRILARMPPPRSERVALKDTCGRIVAQPVTATIDLPPFDNSAVDGYAVRATDTTGATGNRPVRLPIIDRVIAGQAAAVSLQPATCVRLFTGSPLPAGADSVVMQEDTRTQTEKSREVEIVDSVRPWENVRFRGEDVKCGATIAQIGERIGAGLLMLMAAAGVAEVAVGRQPVVTLLATGSELAEPGEALQAGKIYESNRAGLAPLIHRAGGIAKSVPVVRDEFDLTRSALVNAFETSDVVLTCGGVSVGEMDFVKDAFEGIGGKLEFWKVAIKPGRPFAFGQLDNKFLFALPGNPVSALVTFLLLVRPALLRWQGAVQTGLPSHPAILGGTIANTGDRRHFVRVTVDNAGTARSAGTQASHILSSAAAANGLIDLPPRTTLPDGSTIAVLRWE